MEDRARVSRSGRPLAVAVVAGTASERCGNEAYTAILSGVALSRGHAYRVAEPVAAGGISTPLRISS